MMQSEATQRQELAQIDQRHKQEMAHAEAAHKQEVTRLKEEVAHVQRKLDQELLHREQLQQQVESSQHQLVTLQGDLEVKRLAEDGLMQVGREGYSYISYHHSLTVLTLLQHTLDYHNIPS